MIMVLVVFTTLIVYGFMPLLNFANITMIMVIYVHHFSSLGFFCLFGGCMVLIEVGVQLGLVELS